MAGVPNASCGCSSHFSEEEWPDQDGYQCLPDSNDSALAELGFGAAAGACQGLRGQGREPPCLDPLSSFVKRLSRLLTSLLSMPFMVDLTVVPNPGFMGGMPADLASLA